MDTPTIIFSTSQVKISTWSEELIGGFATCYSTTSGSSTTYIVELTAGINPRSGCQYSLTNPFDNNTAFEKGTLYIDLLQYSLTSSAIIHFSQTFPRNNLKGDEWTVACTAFDMEEGGYTFCIIIHPNETSLKSFCEINGWNYKEL